MGKIFFVLCISGLVISGCATSYQDQKGQNAVQTDQLTVGTVQREIKKGMSGAEVIQALGSPNVVSTDEQGREVWVYDKIGTDRVESGSSGGVWLVFFGVSGHSGSASTSQRTLTIVIKFDEQKKVRDFAYHSSRF